MAMTEVTTEVPVQQESTDLVNHAFYKHGDLVLLAMGGHLISDTGMGTDTSIRYTPDVDTTLLARPGTAEWVERMVRARNALALQTRNLQRELDGHVDHWQRFGEAVLEKADEMSWCEEYDRFAEEWDLPQRNIEFEVVMSVRIEARNEEQAIEIAANGVHLDSYSTNGVISSPDFDANRAH